MSETIGIVGVGRMGGNMARRLKDEGLSVAAVFDARREAAEGLASELGCASPETLGEVARACSVVITVVPDDAAMRAIFDPARASLLSGDASGKLFINCATVSPEVHVEVERWAQSVGALSLEASMASSIPQARAGTLYLMCGGSTAAFERARPVLRALSTKTRYIGPAGTAAQVKALVNMVMNINTAGLAEGLGLGNALGLDLGMLREVFSETGANSRVLETDAADMVAREFDCFFSAAHAAKDSGIALRLAEAQGLRLPLAAATKAQYDLMIEKGLGDLDKSGVAELTFKGRS